MGTWAIISAVINVLLGGTSVVAIVKWVSERKKRDIETAGKQIEVDNLEFETLKRQLEFQDERFNSLEAKMKERDKLDDEMRNEMIVVKRSKYELEVTVLRLSNQLAVKEEEYNRDACLNKECTKRQKPNIKI